MQAVILAGGFGKRLRPLTDEFPKPMILVGGVPILEREILWLKDHKISEFVICVGYKKERIMDYFGSGKNLSVDIEYSIEKDSLGTGGALRNAGRLIKQGTSKDRKFIFTYGDIMTNLDPQDLIKESKYSDIKGVMAIVPLRSPFGIVEMDKETNKVLGFKEKPVLYEHWINAGVFCFDYDILDMLPQNGSLESITLEKLAKEGKLGAVRYPTSQWRSIDSHKDIEEAEREFPRMGPVFQLHK